MVCVEAPKILSHNMRRHGRIIYVYIACAFCAANCVITSDLFVQRVNDIYNCENSLAY